MYPNWFKAKVLAWHKGRKLIEAHTQAAINKKVAASAKKGKKG